jgi:hypothetical protein
VGLDSIAVAGVVQTVTARTAILDSGTTAILVGADDASAIHAVRRASLAAAPRAAHATRAAHAPAKPAVRSKCMSQAVRQRHAALTSPAPVQAVREAQRGAPADGPCAGAAAQAIPGVTYNAVGGYYGIDAGCAGVDALPNVSFAINGNVYALPPWQWTQAVCWPPPPFYS